MMTGPTPPPATEVASIVERALAEDLGRGGDLTTDAVIDPDAATTARIVARAGGRIAGIAVATAVFHSLDPRAQIDVRIADGTDAEPGEVIATVGATTRAILTGERTALNLLGHLSGIATATRAAVAAVAGTGAIVVDTRKTTPGLRALEKYAVRCGGGRNHRFGLDDAVMIKDNHIVAAGGIREAVDRVRAVTGHTVKVEVEVDRLDQLDEAMQAGIDIVLLDNMTPDQLRAAVEQVGGRCITEASGGITPETIKAVAATGVDIISLGWITHSAPSLDVSLDL